MRKSRYSGAKSIRRVHKTNAGRRYNAGFDGFQSRKPRLPADVFKRAQHHQSGYGYQYKDRSFAGSAEICQSSGHRYRSYGSRLHRRERSTGHGAVERFRRSGYNNVHTRTVDNPVYGRRGSFYRRARRDIRRRSDFYGYLLHNHDNENSYARRTVSAELRLRDYSAVSGIHAGSLFGIFRFTRISGRLNPFFTRRFAKNAKRRLFFIRKRG